MYVDINHILFKISSVFSPVLSKQWQINYSECIWLHSHSKKSKHTARNCL